MLDRSDRTTLDTAVTLDWGANSRDVRIRARGNATVADLITALEQVLDVRVTAASLGVEASASLADLGLKLGQRISVSTPVTGERAAGLIAGVEGGPCNGQTFPVGPHGLIVGRSAPAGMVVADSVMSRSHLEIVSTDGGIVVRDLDSSNGTFLDGEEVGDAPVPLRFGEVLEAGASLITVVGQESASREVPDHRGRVAFNRPPRTTPPDPAAHIELNVPAEGDRSRRLPMVSSLAPLAAAGVLAAITGQSAYLLVAAMSPVIALISWWEERRGGATAQRRRVRQFDGELAKAGDQVSLASLAEASLMREEFPGAVSVAGAVSGRDAFVWHRQHRDRWFGSVRVGWSDLRSSSTLSYGNAGAPNLVESAREWLEPMCLMRGVPVVVSLPEAGVVGIAGPREQALRSAAWMVAQLASVHSPRDLRLAFALGADGADALSATRWLPHDVSSPGSPPGDPESVIATVTGQLHARSKEQTHPLIVLVVDGDAPVSRSALTPLLEDGPIRGICTIWLGSELEHLPAACGAVVDLSGEPGKSEVRLLEAGRTIEAVRADGLHDGVLDQIARGLAPLRDMSAEESGRLPDRLGLVELLDVVDLDAAVEERWLEPTEGLSAPLGMRADGQFAVDLRADGPHALVGGTTGSGKSELLQTLVASLALHHPPERLNFILVDYKGGAAFRSCVDLPHTVGFVTDLDGRLAQRALISLDAELTRREHLLAEHGAKDLLTLIRREPDAAPPAILIAFDEFAALTAELPDFVDGVVDIAQRGRSLGVHLLLATQRPAGAINDNIRANTNLRIGLRMSDDADSTDVIGVVSAARLPRTLPGRGFARTGHSELVEFQAAYVGGPHGLDAPGDRKVEVSLLDGRQGASGGSGRSELEAVVGAVRRAWAERSGGALHRPWLPELPTDVAQDEIPPTESGAAVGVVDVPEQQAQLALVFDPLAPENWLIVGMPRTGKTTALITFGCAAVRSGSGAVVYSVDFASGGLDALDEVAAGRVSPGDEESLVRFVGLLTREIQERSDGGRAEPPVVVLVDGLGRVLETLEDRDFGRPAEAFRRQLRDGPSVGVTFVVSASQRSETPFGILGSFARKLVLRQASPDDLSLLGLRPVDQSGFPSGRALTENSTEVQMARPALPERFETRSTSPPFVLKTLTEREPLAPYLPATLEELIIGLDVTDGRPAGVSLSVGPFVVAGPPGSGRTATLRTLATAWRSAGGRVVGVDCEGPWLDGTVTVASLVGMDLGQGVLLVVDDAGGLEDADADSIAERWRDYPFLVAFDPLDLRQSYEGLASHVRGARSGILLQADLDADGDLLGVTLPRSRVGIDRPGRGFLVTDRRTVREIQVLWAETDR